MNKYLARLKSEKQPPSELPKLPKVQNAQTYELPKLPKPPFDSYDSTSGMRFLEIQGAITPDLHRLVGEVMSEVDMAGRPWPPRFFLNLPEVERTKIRELGKEIDQAVLKGDSERATKLLEKWRAILLANLN